LNNGGIEEELAIGAFNDLFFDSPFGNKPKYMNWLLLADSK
jgi:hypothetical protein